MKKYAFVFPGQGSQRAGMLNDIATQYSVVGHTFSRASNILGYDLWQVATSGKNIDDTEITQPLMLAASYSIYQIIQQALPKPSYMAGHSLGEWSALVCSGVLEFEEAIRLVQLRGQYMQRAAPKNTGAMAAIIGLDDVAVIDLCNQIENVWAVNFNSPGQVVVAGLKIQIEQLLLSCQKAGAKRALMLPVSAPFHTPLMQPAADNLQQDIQQITFSQPLVPIVHNASLEIASSPEQIKELIIRQITSAVPWTKTIEYMASQGVTSLVEIGYGKVLYGLIKRIDSQIEVQSSDTLAALEKIGV